MSEIKTILWDVGGPIINEDPMIPKWEIALIEAATEVTGTLISRETFDRINRETIDSYAPFAFRTIMFKLVGEVDDLFEAGFRRFKEMIPSFSMELQPGIYDLLKELSMKLPMGIVANQDDDLVDRLQKLDIENCFEIILFPRDYGLCKPDTRAFMRVLDYLDIQPQYALMIGDRLDNDIVPAKMLGMKALLLRSGWHRNQRLRTPDERPDWIASDIPEMISLLRELTA
jgi:HAD superfamily hydrolase (TIGR01549 family)